MTARIMVAFLLLPTMLLSLASCSKPPELSEIKDEIVSLIEESAAINNILFGTGLDTNSKMESPYDNYECVDFKTGFFSVDDIKEAAEKVYTTDYLSPIYEVMFTGKYDSVAGSVIRARYMDSEGYLLKYVPKSDDVAKPDSGNSGNSGNSGSSGSEGSTGGSETTAPDNTVDDPNDFIGSETREYDYSTIEIIKPSRADYVTFTVQTTKKGISDKVTLAIALTSDGWRLDYPTY